MRLLVLPVLMLLVAPTATVGQVFWSDDFDSTAPSAGTRTVLGFANTDGGFCNNDYFVRTNDNDGIDPPADFNAIWAGIHGAFYWRAEDFDSCAPPTGEITWSGIDITGRADLHFAALFAARDSVTWEDSNGSGPDFIRVLYNIDGSGLTPAFCFAGGGPATGTTATMAVDSNCDGDADPAGAALSETMTEFSFAIPQTGTSMELRIWTATNAGGEELAFDWVRLSEGAPTNDEIFSDGFESGDASAWSAAVGG